MQEASIGGESKSTSNHEVIKRWVEDRGGWPAALKGPAGKKKAAESLRIDFPEYGGRQNLKKISWGEFFRKFDGANLAFLYQESTQTGRISRFNKLVQAEAVSSKPLWNFGRQKRAAKGKHAMNIFDMIVHDHENVKSILHKMMISTTRAGRTREQLLAKLRDEISQHMFAEEQIFYPFLMDQVDDREPVHEALEEHRSARIVLSDVEDTPVEDESWHPKLKVLHEQIDHHILNEESDIFELAHEFIDDDTAQELGQKFQSFKKEARAERMETAGWHR